MRDLLLPCETRVREFDAKLLVALQAAERGIVSVVGSKKVMDLRLATFRPSVYVGKSLTGRNLLNFSLVPKAGHRLVAWDEEGLVWASREVYWRTKLDGQALGMPQLLMAWGEENASAWREFPEYTGNPIAITGNPRSDLLRPELANFFADEVDALRQQYGRFVLINTNFSRVNHVQPAQNRHLRWLREQRPDDPRGGFAGHKFNLFNAFRDMLPRLARALPGITLIVRPHPSERQQTWQEIAGDLPNVHVSHEGNVVPWLLAARGLIHNGCTTAVEAFVMHRPALAYMPVRSPQFDHPLPNGLSMQYEDVEALAAATRECEADPQAMFERQANDGRRTLLQRNVAASEGALASQRVLEAMRPLLEDTSPVAGASPRVARASLFARRVIREAQARVPGQGNHRAYLEHMFPSTTAAEVTARLDLFRECLGIARPPRVEQIAPNLFRISPGADPAASDG